MRIKMLVPCVLALTALAIAPFSAQGQVAAEAVQAQGQVTADAVLRDFDLTGDYELEVDGKVQLKAKVYQSRTAGVILVRSSALESPLLFNPRAGSVQTVSLMSLNQRPDGRVDIMADAEVIPLGSFKMEGSDVVFTAFGQQGTIRPKPPLTGLKNAAELLEYSAAYEQKASLYEPDAGDVASLRSRTKDVRVKVYFGSWCPFCKTYIPRMLSVDQALAGSKVSVEYYGLPKPPFDDEPEVKKAQLHGIPTGIVYVEGREVGRIEKQMWMQPEKTLLRLLSGS